MDRRAFLTRLGLGTAAIAVAGPELLEQLAQPRRTYFDLGARSARVVFHRGDIVTFEGVFARNPFTGLYTHHLQRFVIVEDCASDVVPPAIVYPPFLDATPREQKKIARVLGKSVVMPLTLKAPGWPTRGLRPMTIYDGSKMRALA